MTDERHREHGERDLPACRSAPPRAGASPFSRWRTMFSMTTMASSMRRPIESVSASIVIDVEGEAERVHHREGADDRGRQRDRGDDASRASRAGTRARRGRRGSRRGGGRAAPPSMEPRMNLRVVGDDARARRPRGAAARSAARSLLHALRHLDRVRARLLAHDERHGGAAVERRGGARLARGRPPRRDVAHADRLAARARDDEVAQLVDRLRASVSSFTMRSRPARACARRGRRCSAR